MCLAGVPEAPLIPKTLNTPLWLDTKLETITRLQTKPGNEQYLIVICLCTSFLVLPLVDFAKFASILGQMYTFVCAKEFRRDEFAHHSKTVHDIIIGGMNNWLEHRCPLAIYGCGFSQRRFFPGTR